MSVLAQEEIIMTSNDNSITLTTHRILQKTKDANKEILLKDIISQEVVRKKHRYYQNLLMLFGIPAALMFLLYLSKAGPFERVFDGYYERNNHEGATTIMILLFVLTGIAFYLFQSTSGRWLKISGRFGEIEFSLKDLGDSSLNRFLNRLTVESDNRKREG